MSNPDPLNDPENTLPDDGPNPEDIRAQEKEEAATDEFIENQAFGI